VAGPVVDTPILRLEDMPPGTYLAGPAIIESDDTSYAVNQGWTAVRSSIGNVVIERRDPSADPT
jgi:N-methylhydantoinase A/oxoprolinase/acetone carboxylase beta subunit